MAAIAESIDASRKTPRIGLLDTARGVALLAMASYHFTWDLEFFGYLDTGTAETGWLKLYARCIASSFLFLAGFSLVLANVPDIRWRSFGRRLAMIAGAAAAISLVTFIGMRDEWIFFGILHCIAAASLVGLLFVRLPAAVTLLVAIALTAALVVDIRVSPSPLHSQIFDAPWLRWVGLSQSLPRSNDYVPLFPWLIPFLYGLGISRLAFSRGWLAPLARLGTGGSPFARIGRHSLAFYLIHQPLLFGLVYLASLAIPAPKPDPDVGYLGQCQASCLRSASETVCRSFCPCTLAKLKSQSLLEPLQSGRIQADNDEQIQRIAIQCSPDAQ